MTLAAPARGRFQLPDGMSAAEPPEARGLHRDEVRLLVVDGAGDIRHDTFRRLSRHLHPGDALVVNTSATLPAAVDATLADGTAVVVHVSGPAADGDEVVELRTIDGTRFAGGTAGDTLALPGGASATLLARHPQPGRRASDRLWVARLATGTRSVAAYLRAYGRPITYGYLRGSWPLRTYQTIFARVPGSAEMPSAARPFSRRLLVDLVTRGISIVPITLHTGVSSLEAEELPLAERYEVSAASAAAINAARRHGGRVVAVGTTAARAVESAATPEGRVVASRGWTDLVLGPQRPAFAIDGLITGWHEPQASHLLLLDAVAGERLVDRAYEAAVAARYRWHEFGDSCLFLPRSDRH